MLFWANRNDPSHLCLGYHETNYLNFIPSKTKIALDIYISEILVNILIWTYIPMNKCGPCFIPRDRCLYIKKLNIFHIVILAALWLLALLIAFDHIFTIKKIFLQYDFFVHELVIILYFLIQSMSQKAHLDYLWN